MIDHLSPDTIALAVSGALSGADARAAELHLATCRECSLQAGHVSKVAGALAAAPQIPMPAPVAARLKAVIATEVERRAVLAAKALPGSAGGHSAAPRPPLASDRPDTHLHV